MGGTQRTGSANLFDGADYTEPSEYSSRQGEKIDTLQIHHATNMLGYDDEINRDTWYDAVVLTYKWTDVLNDSYTVVDTASEPNFSHVYHEVKEDTPYPGPGTAAVMLQRFLTRGRTIPVTAIADYHANPGMTAIVTTPDTGNRSGFITSITWDNEGVMRMNARDVRIVPDEAWLNQDAEPWTDGPVGESWLDA